MSGWRGARRVALVTAADALGGAERVMELLAARLDRHGIAPVLSGPESPLLARWAREGFEVCPLPPFGRRRRLDHGARSVADIARRFEAAGIALVHTHGVAAQLHGGLAARRCGLPAIYHVHDLFEPRWSADGALQRLALRVPAERTIAISASVAASIRGRVPAARLHTVVDGVPREIVEPVARPHDLASPLVVWCGRLQRWKGAHAFIAAAAAVHARHPEARFAVVGGTLFGLEPDHAERLRRQAADLDMAHAMTFAGHVADARPWLRAADLVVHCSERPEPFGLVMAEAMMQQRAVVAFRQGGAAEIVLDGQTGLLVAPGDVDALADAVASLLADPSRRRAMGDIGRERALRYFDADAMTAGVAAVYDRIPDAHG